ncbi:hypothetical protein AGMMS50239_25030 [Bacteroidia bacterium]|nr:hypothetical protein AGMMS50239_25030 [Bacteroidia bacterium]
MWIYRKGRRSTHSRRVYRYISNLKESIYADIQKIELSESDISQKSLKIIQVLEKTFEDLKTFILDYTFKDQTKEKSLNDFT